MLWVVFLYLRSCVRGSTSSSESWSNTWPRALLIAVFSAIVFCAIFVLCTSVSKWWEQWRMDYTNFKIWIQELAISHSLWWNLWEKEKRRWGKFIKWWAGYVALIRRVMWTNSSNLLVWILSTGNEWLIASWLQWIYVSRENGDTQFLLTSSFHRLLLSNKNYTESKLCFTTLATTEN